MSDGHSSVSVRCPQPSRAFCGPVGSATPLPGSLVSEGPGQAGWAGEWGTHPTFALFLRVALSRHLFSPRSIESPNLGFCTDPLLPNLLEDDLGQLSDLEPEPDAQNWQHTVGKDVVARLSQREIDRQEVINGETSCLSLLPH